MKGRMFTCLASQTMKRGDVVPFSGEGHFVCLNDAAVGETFWVFMRQGIEPLPNPGKPGRSPRPRRFWHWLQVRWDMIVDA